jgi:hypothetical protein
MRNLFVITLFAGALLAGCGKKEELKYHLVENQCDTGEHTADSKDQMCSMLKYDGVNNGCAYTLRKQKYEGDGCGSWGS